MAPAAQQQMPPQGAPQMPPQGPPGQQSPWAVNRGNIDMSALDEAYKNLGLGG